MIAKNEAHCIGNAIESVKPIVSEIILVDTGSTDGTQNVAKQLGAKVIEDSWKDDFALHRNQSIEAATGDWILVLDADEVISSKNLEQIKSLVKAKDTCYLLTQRHYSEDHRLSDFHPCRGEFPEYERGIPGYFESSCVRLFPKHPLINYRGKVHELVEHSINESKQFKILHSQIRIHHFGHTAQYRAKKQKHTIYGPLGEKKIKEDPKNWQAFFELGVEYNVNNDKAKSLEALTKAAEMNPQYVPTWVNRGYVLCELERYEEAIQDLKRAINLDPRSYEAYGNWGVSLMRQGKFNEAIPVLERAIQISPTFINGLANLGRSYAHVGRLTESSLAFERAVKLGHGSAHLTSELCTLFIVREMPEEAMKWLLRAHEIENCPEALLLLGLAYKKLGDISKSKEYLEKISSMSIPETMNDFLKELQQ